MNDHPLVRFLILSVMLGMGQGVGSSRVFSLRSLLLAAAAGLSF